LEAGCQVTEARFSAQGEGNFEIGRILHLKFETRNLRMDSLACGVWVVHSEISSFEFEMQDSSNFKISPTGLAPILYQTIEEISGNA